MTSPTFQMSADARLLMQHMSSATVGQTFTYKELGAVISRDVDGSSGPLRTALRRLLRDEGMVFGTLIGEGVKRLNDEEIVAEGGNAAEAIRRKANRSFERQMKADFSRLPRQTQAKFTAQVSVMASIAMMTTGKALERVAAAASPALKEMPVAATLAMFVGAPK
ncbi:hypothetical protein JP75_07615 [Devosia riboflavina]|uniref:Uncharacterized protein n=1 Tax=Devosia riboflavina TaxID=46914 RepID=A0A087M3G5_9HYPH|nr:hypothetical protein [Devosia riboflavina]KFL31418.1 hypothetical protein JP75_07615 [Devosia riboflavina]